MGRGPFRQIQLNRKPIKSAGVLLFARSSVCLCITSDIICSTRLSHGRYPLALLTDSFRQDFFHFNMRARNHMYRDQLTNLLAAAEPASVVALTAPTSPRTITVTNPEPIFRNQPGCVSGFHHGICGVAETRPFVSTIPNASLLHNDLTSIFPVRVKQSYESPIKVEFMELINSHALRYYCARDKMFARQRDFLVFPFSAGQ